MASVSPHPESWALAAILMGDNGGWEGVPSRPQAEILPRISD